MREDQADKMITELRWISWGLVKVPLIIGAFALLAIVFTKCGTYLSEKSTATDHLEGLGEGLRKDFGQGDMLPVIVTNAPPSKEGDAE